MSRPRPARAASACTSRSGRLAARTVARAIDERATDPFLLAEERVSLRAFARSLARRDFFLQLGWFFETQRDEPLQARMRRFPFARNHPGFAAWQEGRTGYPLVDAGVRELRATGFMHPHARLVAASFCCFDLGVDWRRGRDVWDRLLTEDEPALANANWQWVAGVGADLAAYPRIYNPTRQARRYDPDALYAQAWIPEVAGLPAAEILDPLARSRRPQLLLPLFDGAHYRSPSSITNPPRARSCAATASLCATPLRPATAGRRAFAAYAVCGESSGQCWSSQSLISGTRTSSPCQAFQPYMTTAIT